MSIYIFWGLSEVNSLEDTQRRDAQNMEHVLTRTNDRLLDAQRRLQCENKIDFKALVHLIFSKILNKISERLLRISKCDASWANHHMILLSIWLFFGTGRFLHWNSEFGNQIWTWTFIMFLLMVSICSRRLQRDELSSLHSRCHQLQLKQDFMQR